MNDDRLISLNAALDTLNEIKITKGANWYEFYQKALTAVGILPSAQPTDEDIQRMQDIEQAMLGKAYECGKQDAQRWIPWDSGKFPGESGYYTVTAYDGTTKRVTHAKYQKRLKRWELTGARAYWRVLAWMPLPEPWKGEKP